LTLWTAPPPGGLVTYGDDIEDGDAPQLTLTRFYVAPIPRTADEQPTKFELVISSRAAKALGLIVPPSILIRADHIID
jgi:putative ABC transport system substrate-binding protein